MAFQQSRVAVWQLLLLSYLMLVVTAAQQQQESPAAECRIELRGYGKPGGMGGTGVTNATPKAGIASASLQCTSSSASSVEIGINSAQLGPFAHLFTGITVVDNLRCQQQNPTRFTALLYFCSNYRVNLVRPHVEGVYIQEASAVFVIAGNASISVIEGLFVDNGAGTVVALMENATVQLQNTTISSNMGNKGTAVYAQDTAQAYIAKSTITYNFADSEGGGIYGSGNSKVLIDKQTIISSNKAKQSGAGVRLTDHAFLLLQGSSEKKANNSVTGNGGGVDMDGSSNLTMKQSSIISNTAQSNLAAGGGFGGGLRVADSAVAAITGGSHVARNQALFGGGLYIQSSGQVWVNASTIGGNAADLGTGGGLYLISSARVMVNNSLIEYNSAYSGGGGMYLTSYAKLTNSVLQGNTVSRMNVALAGGIQAEFDAQVKAINVLFVNNSAAIGGAVYAKDQANVTLQHVTCHNNMATLHGGCAEVEGNATLYIDHHSRVENNRAREGAALYCKNYATVMLARSIVSGNAAGVSGGGVSVSVLATLTLTNATVVNNTAVLMGGGLYVKGNGTIRLQGNSVISANAAKWGGGVCLSSDSSFNPADLKHTTHANSGRYASDISLAPTTMSILGNKSIADFVSQLGTDKSVLVVRLKVSGQYGMPCDGQVVQAHLNGTDTLGVNRSDVSGFVLMRLYIRQPPGPYVVGFSLIPGDGPAPLVAVQPVNISLTIRSCVVGEVMPARDVCEVCAEGSYSLDPQSPSCVDCPGGASCPGGATIVPLKGFWHSAPDSILLNRCPNPSACLGGRCTHAGQQSLAGCQVGLDYVDLQCSQGYRGNLCGVCIPRHAMVGLFECRSCMPEVVSVLLFLLAFVVMGMVIKWMSCCAAVSSFPCRSAAAARGASQQVVHDSGNLTGTPRQRQQMPSRATQQQERGTLLLIMLKSLVLYMQYALIISIVPGVSLPGPIAHASRVLGWFWAPALPVTVSAGCILPISNWVPSSIQSTLFYLAMPLAMLVMMLALDLLPVQCSVQHCKLVIRRCDQRTWIGKASKTTAAVGFVFAPSILRVGFNMFVCKDIHTQGSAVHGANELRSFWVLDMQQECFTGYHRPWAVGLGMSVLVITMGGLLVLVIVLAKKASRQAHNAPSGVHCAFLQTTYKPTFCYWDAVVLLQTAAFTVVATFGFKLGPYHHIVALSFVLAVFISAWWFIQPFVAANQVVVQALISLLLANLASLAYLDYDTAPRTDVRAIGVGIAVLLIQGVFLLSVFGKVAMLLGESANLLP